MTKEALKPFVFLGSSAALVVLLILGLNRLGAPPGWRSPVAPKSDLAEISSQPKEGVQDFVFRAESVADEKDMLAIEAKGLYRGKAVNFGIGLIGPWDKTVTDPPTPATKLRTGNAIVHTLGPGSDLLLRAMAELYGLPRTPGKMAKDSQAGAVCYAGDPAKAAEGMVRVKLFLREKGSNYAEAYLDIDLPRHRLRFGEVDSKYRDALVRWFEKGAFYPQEPMKVRYQ